MSFDTASSSATAATVFGGSSGVAGTTSTGGNGAAGSGLDALQSLFSGMLSAASSTGDAGSVIAGQGANSKPATSGGADAAFLVQALSTLQSPSTLQNSSPAATDPTGTVQAKAADASAAHTTTASASLVSLADALTSVTAGLDRLSETNPTPLADASEPASLEPATMAKSRAAKTDKDAEAAAATPDAGASSPPVLSNDGVLAQSLLAQLQVPPPVQTPVQTQVNMQATGKAAPMEGGKPIAPALPDAAAPGLPSANSPLTSASTPLSIGDTGPASPANRANAISSAATADVTGTVSPVGDFAALLAANGAAPIASEVPATGQGSAKAGTRPVSSSSGVQTATSSKITASAPATGVAGNQGAPVFTLSADRLDQAGQVYSVSSAVKAVSQAPGKASDAEKGSPEKEALIADAKALPVQPDMARVSDAGIRESAVQAFTGEKTGLATAATSPVTAPAPGAQMSQASVQTLTDLGLQIQHRLSSGQSQFRVQLTPENLGKVDVVLTIGASGDTRAQLTFDSAATAASMAGRMSELRDQLRQSGLQVADDAVSVASVDATAGLSTTGGNTHATEATNAVSHAAADTQVAPAASGASSGNLSGNGSQTQGQSMPQTYDQSGSRHHAQSQPNNRGQQPGLADVSGAEITGPVANATDSELSLLRNSGASRLALNLIV